MSKSPVVAAGAVLLLAAGLARKPRTEPIDPAVLVTNLRAFADDLEAGNDGIDSVGGIPRNEAQWAGYIGLRDLFRALHARDAEREAFERSWV